MKYIKKRTHEEYIAELAVKNPTLEVLEEYVDANTKILHRCLIHDYTWYIKPSNALMGHGCKYCHGERIASSRTKTHDDYIELLKNVTTDIVPLEEYRGMTTKILHACLRHSVEWETIPYNILLGCGCSECMKEKIGSKNKKDFEQYKKELLSCNPDIVCIGEYTKSTEKALHMCKACGNQWYNLPSQILYGRGCPKCNESYGEREIRIYLDKYGIKYDQQHKFDGCVDKKELPFDFYLPDYNTAIEYDGYQHFTPVQFFGGYDTYQKLKTHDSIKDNYCKDNNITLLRISYNENVNEKLNNFFTYLT